MSQRREMHAAFVDVIHFKEKEEQGMKIDQHIGTATIGSSNKSCVQLFPKRNWQNQFFFFDDLTVCNFIVHEKCVTNVVTPCSGVAPCLIKNPVAHCWSEPTHHKRRFCNVCRKRLDETAAVHCLSKSTMTSKTNVLYSLSFHSSMRILRPHWVPGLCDCRLQGKRNIRARQGASLGEAHSSLARGKFAAIFQMRLLQENLLVVRVLDGWALTPRSTWFPFVDLWSDFFQDIAVSGVDLLRMAAVVTSSPKSARSECYSLSICRRTPSRYRELKCQWKQ